MDWSLAIRVGEPGIATALASEARAQRWRIQAQRSGYWCSRATGQVRTTAVPMPPAAMYGGAIEPFGMHVRQALRSAGTEVVGPIGTHLQRLVI